MAKGLTFSAVLKLQKQQFDAGIREVKKSLNDLKSTFTQIAGALGAGLGLASFIGNMKETAVELSVVKATLENVSKSTEEYGESLEFLRRIAKEYGQDQNALTMAFAKFSAAARGAGVELETVKSIYESLTRAAGAYHLSAESTASVMLAVEQMFSKGKVTAEELRRQLGNSLPGAFNMMATAAGKAGITLNGTAAELDKAMRAGQVMASEVMPYFARELDKATSGANFDSLQSSLNRLSNSWYNFVEESNMEGAFNGLVKAGTGALNAVSWGLKTTGIQMRDIAIALAGGLGFSALKKQGEVALVSIYEKAEKVVDTAQILKGQIMSLEMRLQELKSLDPLETIKLSITAAQAKIAGLEQEIIDCCIVAEEMGKTFAFTTTAAEGIAILDKNIQKLGADVAATSAEAKKLSRDITLGSTGAGKAVIGLRKAFGGLLSVLKSVGVMLIATFAISLITRWIEEISKAISKAKELRDLPQNTLKEAEAMTDTTKEQIAYMQKQVNILKYYAEDEEKVKNAIEEINKGLERQEGELFDINSDINDIQAAVDEWGNSIIESAKSLQKWEKLQEVEDKIANLNAQLLEIKDSADYNATEKYWDNFGHYVERATVAAEGLAKQEKEITKQLNAQIEARNALIAAGALNGAPTPGVPADTDVKEISSQLDEYKRSADQLLTQKKNGALTEKEYQKELQKTQAKVFKQISTYENLDGIVTRLDVDHKKLFTDIKNGFKAASTGGGGGGGSAKKTPIDSLRDAMDGYIEKITELKNQLKNGVINQDEFDKGIVNIVTNAEKSVGAFENMGEALKQLGGDYERAFNEMLGTKKAAEESMNFEKMFEEAKEAIDKSTDALMDALDRYWEKSKEILGEGMPEQKQRNTFFDYKKSKNDIAGEQADNAEDYLKRLEELKKELIELGQSIEGGLDPVMQDFLDQLNIKLKEATKNAKDLRSKANLAELSEDIEKFTKALREAQFNSIKEVASSFDRLVKSIESVDDAIDKLGSSTTEPLDELKALIAIINEIIQTVTTVKSVIEGFNTVQEALAKKRAADNALMLTQATAVVGAQEAQAAAEAHSAAATVAAEGTKQAAMAATTTAEAGSAIAGAASSVASVPYVGPILAAAAVASMVALFAANLKKFAGGGIVNGPSVGDRNLVRANGGEMILNKHQQSTLFNMLNGKGGNTPGQVEFKIRGSDLVGTINNYQSKQRGWG